MTTPRPEAFRAEVQQKIQSLVQEFTQGKISREQFNILYARYNSQLEIAHEAIALRDSGALNEASEDLSTIAVRKATEGKAVGLAIYHHRSGTTIETLGNFDIAPGLITPVLNEFSMKLEERSYIEPLIKEAKNGLWLVFAARQYTTIVTVFRNEPAPVQVRELQRLHHDFEEANSRYLDANMVDPGQLASPFIAFVQKKLNG